MKISAWKVLSASIILTCIVLPPVLADIYRWVDKQGNVHFSDKPVAGQKATRHEFKSSLNAYQPGSLPELNSEQRYTRPIKRGTLPQLSPRKVIIYSTEWCTYCTKAKAYFKRKGIRYSERDIEKSSQARKEYRALGGDGVPLILVGHRQGTRKLSGFSESRFAAAYQ